MWRTQVTKNQHLSNPWRTIIREVTPGSQALMAIRDGPSHSHTSNIFELVFKMVQKVLTTAMAHNIRLDYESHYMYVFM